MKDLVVFEASMSKAELLAALAESSEEAEAAREAFTREMSISFVEFCIWMSLWGMFGVARERLFKEGVLLTKEQFMGIGFKTMLPPLTLLRIGMAGWTYSVVQEPPLIPRPQSKPNGRPARENTIVKTIGLE
jgi:hypothetical protein